MKILFVKNLLKLLFVKVMVLNCGILYDCKYWLIKSN